MFLMRDDVSGQLFEHLLCTVLRSDFAESFHDNAVFTSEGKVWKQKPSFLNFTALISMIKFSDRYF